MYIVEKRKPTDISNVTAVPTEAARINGHTVMTKSSPGQHTILVLRKISLIMKNLVIKALNLASHLCPFHKTLTLPDAYNKLYKVIHLFTSFLSQKVIVSP